jgi:predicted Zn finger-like uncharacterized protein
MSQTFVTQCPHCQTRFRVNREQLAIANGSVRCGACLQVFDAATLLADQLKQATPAPEVALQPLQPLHLKDHHAPLKLEKTPAILAADHEPLWIHDDLDMDDLDEELARLDHQEQRKHEPRPQGSSNREQRANSSGDDFADDDVPPEEAWALALLRDETTPARAELPPAPFKIPEEDLPRPVLHTNVVVDRKEPTIELPPPVAPKKVPQETIAIEPPRKVARELDPQADEELHPSKNRARIQELEELSDEPIQLDWRRPRKRWGRRLTWAGLNLLALLVLAGQYVWYHFDELARQDQYRPWFAAICPEVGCNLPSKVDINQIRSSNLVVRSHPEFSGALVVDAIIYNRATFAQPFPLLELRFADLSGQPIASRRFKPAEYLSGELAGGREMPPQTPIHISLDILDPGPRAVNYSLSFLSPE